MAANHPYHPYHPNDCSRSSLSRQPIIPIMPAIESLSAQSTLLPSYPMHPPRTSKAIRASNKKTSRALSDLLSQLTSLQIVKEGWRAEEGDQGSSVTTSDKSGGGGEGGCGGGDMSSSGGGGDNGGEDGGRRGLSVPQSIFGATPSLADATLPLGGPSGSSSGTSVSGSGSGTKEVFRTGDIAKLVQGIASAGSDEERAEVLVGLTNLLYKCPASSASVCAAGAVPLLAALLRENCSEDLRCIAATVIASLTLRVEIIEVMAQCGLIEPLVRLLKSKLPVVLREASRALANLAKSRVLVEQAGACGAIKLLVKLLDSDDIVVVDRVVHALHCLTSESDGNAALSLKAGAATPLIRLLDGSIRRRGSTDQVVSDDLRLEAAAVLTSMLKESSDAVVSKVFSASGTIASVVRLLNRGMCQEVQQLCALHIQRLSATLLKKAALCGSVDTELIAGGVLPAMVNLLTVRQSASVVIEAAMILCHNAVIEAALLILCNMAERASRNAAKILSAGAVPCLTPLMLDASANDRVSSLAVRALCLLPLDMCVIEGSVSSIANISNNSCGGGKGRLELTPAFMTRLVQMLDVGQSPDLQYAAVDMVASLAVHESNWANMASVCSVLSRLVASATSISTFQSPTGLPSQLLAVKALYLLTMHPQCQARLVADKGTVPLVRLFQDVAGLELQPLNQHSIDRIMFSVGVMRNLASNVESAEVRVVASGVLPEVVQLLELSVGKTLGRTAHQMADQAAGCLRNLMLHAPDRLRAKEEGVVQILFTMLEGKPADATADAVLKMQAQVLGALRNILLDTESYPVQIMSSIMATVLSGEGGVRIQFLDLLRSNSPLVQEQAAGVLKNITACPLDWKGEGTEEGASIWLHLLIMNVLVLVALMQSASQPVRQEAVGALRNVLLLSPEIRASAITGGSAHVLVKMLGVASSEVGQEHAACALWTLAMVGYAAAIASAGAEPSLEVLLKKTSSEVVRGQAEGALKALREAVADLFAGVPRA